MTSLDVVRRMLAHAAWADERVLNAVRAAGADAPEAAVRESAHMIAATAVWLARLQGRAPDVAIWPQDLSQNELASLRAATLAGYDELLAGLDDAKLTTPVSYTTSDGRPFTDTMADILMHVVLHEQYHRGRINHMLRQAGCEPAPVDHIVFTRGA